MPLTGHWVSRTSLLPGGNDGKMSLSVRGHFVSSDRDVLFISGTGVNNRDLCRNDVEFSFLKWYLKMRCFVLCWIMKWTETLWIKFVFPFNESFLWVQICHRKEKLRPGFTWDKSNSDLILHETGETPSYNINITYHPDTNSLP